MRESKTHRTEQCKWLIIYYRVGRKVVYYTYYTTIYSECNAIYTGNYIQFTKKKTHFSDLVTHI